MDRLEVNTKKGTLSLNGVELDSATEINIKLHDDDRTTVVVTLSPCEVDAHIGIKKGRNDWIGQS